MYRDEPEIIQNINKTLQWVFESAESTLYRDIWKAHGIIKQPKIENISDLAKLPITTKADFLTHPNPADRCYVPKSERSFIASTTGSTTGEPFFIWRNAAGNSYYKKMVDWVAKRALLFWTSYGARVANVAKLTHVGLQTINIDPHRTTEAVSMISTAQIDTLITSPSLALQLATAITDQNVRNQIRFITFWGESTSPTTEHILKEAFPNAALLNAYASAETYGVAMYTTPHCNTHTNICHVNPAETYVEIEDEMILLTSTATPHATPLIRFQMGDCGRWVETPCACGDPNPRVEMLGRSGVDFIRFSGLELQLQRIDAALAPFSHEILPGFQATVTQTFENNQPKNTLEIHIYASPDSNTLPEMLAYKITEAALAIPVSNHLTIEKAIAAAVLEKPVIHIKHENAPVGNKNKRITLIQT